MAFLQLFFNGHYKTHVLPDDRMSIFGRGSHCDFKLELDAELSREHFGVSPDEDGRVLLIDLGSRNGTFINGRKLVNETVPLNDGDEIKAGTQTLIFHDKLPFEKAEKLISDVAGSISSGNGFSLE